jgi:hypothetical protein
MTEQYASAVKGVEPLDTLDNYYLNSTLHTMSRICGEEADGEGGHVVLCNAVCAAQGGG